MRNGHRINQQGVCQQRIQCIKDKESPQITRRLMMGNSGDFHLFIYLFFNRKETDCQVFYPSKAINRKTATCHSKGIGLLNVSYFEGITYHDFVYLMQFIQIDI